jgi:ABC-2 type transport system permease protein
MTIGVMNGDLSPHVYYNLLPGQNFSETDSFDAAYSFIDNKLTVYVNKYVGDLRIDPAPGEGFSVANVSGITKHPRGLIIDPVWAFAWIFAVFGVMLIVFCLRHIGKASAYVDGFKRYAYLLSNLVKKDLTTKYRRSILGILWSVINPLMMMLVITAVFQRIFRIQIENFPLYYLTGTLMFNFVSEATTGAMSSILSSGTLIRKVYIPKYIFPLEKCIFALLNMLFSLIAVIIMYMVLQFTPPPTIALLFIPMLYSFVFSVGLGMILATVNVFFRDMSHLYGVWITVWMYLTPIIYPMEILPEFVKNIVRINPLYYFVDYFRQVAMYGSIPGLRENIACCLFAVIFLLAGLYVFKRKQDIFILYI